MIDDNGSVQPLVQLRQLVAGSLAGGHSPQVTWR